jgi:hypothetical protein
MRLSGLGIAAVFFVSTVSFAQHSSSSSSSSSSSGGGSHSSGGSSSSSGGSSHSSSGGGSGSSSSHSSGGGSGSSSHSSVGGGSHGTSVGSGAHGTPSHSVNSPSSAAVPINRLFVGGSAQPEHERSLRNELRTAQPEKRGFIGFLRHPFRRPEPNPQPDKRRPVCLRGPCQVCPNGTFSANGGCSGSKSIAQEPYCSASNYWRGEACAWRRSRIVDDCSWLRMALERQAQRLREASAVEQQECSASGSGACSEAIRTRQSEVDFYRTMQERYRTCRMGSMGSFVSGFSGLSNRPWGFGAEPTLLDFNF